MDEGKLTAADAEQVLARQRELGWRFGEAAIELNLITDADLRQALAKQYEFPYLVSGPGRREQGADRRLGPVPPGGGGAARACAPSC